MSTWDNITETLLAALHMRGVKNLGNAPHTSSTYIPTFRA